eukprot:334415-Rhodomonas_salina.1
MHSSSQRPGSGTRMQELVDPVPRGVQARGLFEDTGRCHGLSWSCPLSVISTLGVVISRIGADTLHH